MRLPEIETNKLEELIYLLKRDISLLEEDAEVASRITSLIADSEWEERWNRERTYQIKEQLYRNKELLEMAEELNRIMVPISCPPSWSDMV